MLIIQTREISRYREHAKLATHLPNPLGVSLHKSLNLRDRKLAVWCSDLLMHVQRSELRSLDVVHIVGLG